MMDQVMAILQAHPRAVKVGNWIPKNCTGALMLTDQQF